MKARQLLLALVTVGLVSCQGSRVSQADIQCEADLKGHTVAVMAATYYDTKFTKTEGVQVFRVNAEADGLLAVRQGLADAFVTDEVLFTKEDLDRKGFKKACSGDEQFPCSIAFQKGDTVLLPAFNRFLAQMREDGSLEAYGKYWIENGPEVPDPQPAEAVDGKPIRYIAAMTTAPISFLRNGVWTGLDADLIRRFAIWYGRPLEANDIPFASAILALQTGKADIVSGCLFPTDERRTHVDFSDPYYMCRPGIFVVSDDVPEGVLLWERVKGVIRQSFLIERRWKLIADGLGVTVLITLLSILLGTLLGAGFCAMKLGRRKWMRKTADLYGAFMQGVPTLVLLLIMFYVVFVDTNFGAIYVAVITFALGFASSSGSVFAASIKAVPIGQWEAGYALGLSKTATFRHIVFPQALRTSIGPYTGHCIALLKGTSIVGYIAVQDLTRASDLLRARTFEAFMPLLAITVMYFVLAWLLRLLLNLAVPKKQYD